MDYHRMHQVDIRIARIFNTYGPNMCPQDGRVVSNFIVQALQQEPITIYGTGEQSRSFCYVSDNLAGLIKLMNKPGLHTPVNIGNPIELTMKQIATLVLKLTGSNVEVTYHPLPGDDPKQRRPDISKAKAEFGWEPIIDLETGLKKTISYFRERLEIQEASVA
jgi:UDP-glucuronate decarboxylase